MKKKIISLILVISILLSVFPVSVLTTAAEDSAIPATRDEVTKLQSDDDLEINSSAVAAKDTELAETKGAITISLHVWVSDSAFGSVPEKFVARDRVYLCYELIDKNTGQKINSLVNKSYSAVLTLYNPDGSVAHSNEVEDDDNSWISIVPYEAGIYDGTVSVSGDVNVTCDVSFTLVYDATLTSSFSSISLNMNGTNSKTSIITVSGGYPGKYSIQYKIGNTSIVSASWGEWDSTTIPITITGKKPGTTEVTINLLERYTGNDNIVKSITIPVTVTAGTLSVNTSNTATVSTGGDIKYFTYTPSTSGTYVIYSTGSVDTKVYLYNSSGTELDNDDDSGDGNNFRLEYNLTAGTKYTFGVKYYDSTIIGTISFKFGNVYTITYNANGGTGVPSSQKKDYGTNIALSDTIPSRSGYTFLGWSTSSTATSATYQPGSTFSSNANTTLYAVWDESTYTVSYNSNGGSGAPASQTKTHGVDLVLSSTIPTRLGYTFLGWSTSNTASTATYLPEATFTSNADTTLYAVWKQTTLNSGSSNTAQIAFGGQMYYYKFTPSKSGDYVIYSTGSVDTIVCLFDENGTQLSSDDDGGDGTNFRLEYELTAGTTYLFGVRNFSSSYTGTISIKFGEVYTIDYIAYGADIVPVGHYKDYGTDITLSDIEPERDGYIFLGWSTSSTSSTAEYQPRDTFTSNADTILYAVWEQNRELIDMSILLCTVDTCYIGDTLNVTALQLNLTYSDGTNEFVRSGYTISGFDSSTSGTKTVTVSYQGFTDTFTVTVNTPSVALSSTNELLYVGDTAALTATTTPSGKSVTWTSSDTSVATVSNGVITAKSKGTASITAEFTYNGIKYSKVCSVTVLEEVVTYMYVYQEPTKIQYYIGDSLNTSGLKLRLNYSDGTVETVTSGFTTSGFSSTSAGTKTVTVTYKGEMTSFTVTVNTPSVALSSYSNTLKSGHTTTITASTTPNGQSVTWTSSDPSVATVSNGLITAKAKGTTDITAEFTYNGITYRNTCVVNCIEPVGVEIDTLPNKTVFYIGDYFERVGLRLKMLYSDGSYEHGLGVTSTSLDEVAVFLSEGTREVLVYYGEYSTSYQITVNPFYAKLLTTQANLNIGEVSQIAYETSPGDMSQLVSATWSSSNTNVARVDQNGLVTAVGVGTAEITLSIVNGGCGTTSNICTVTVSKKIDDVSIRKSPAKASYYIGDALDTSGLELLATYDDGSTEIITSGFTTSGFNSATAGTKTVTVSYQGFTDIFSVTVNTPSVALSTNSEVLEEGDTATLTATTTPSGQSITWISSDTSVATVSNGVITAKSKGTANITAEFTYNGVKYSQVCTVTVIEEVIELTSIAVSQEPTITQYYVGDSLDTSGLKLKLTYSDGSRATVTRDFTTSGFDSSTSGTKTVTVSYQGFTDTFTVTVNTPSVVLSTDSETLEERDTATLTATTTPSGQSVTWTSSDTSVATVSNGVITAKSKGTANITAEFTYNGVKYSEVCSVTVIEEAIEITSISVYQEPTKTIYYLGDTFDRRGLMVQVHYSNGDVSLLSGGFVTSGFNSTTAGTKTIKVSYQGYTDKFTVTVNTPSIAVSPIRKALNAGDTAILTATTAPGEQSVTWTSSDPNVATVSDGKVKAVCEGTAVIRAEFTYSGVVYSQECVVTVLESILGDVDGDGKITIMDATLVQRSVAKLEALTDEQTLCADTDKDGKISVMDATIIQRFVAKLIEEF